MSDSCIYNIVEFKIEGHPEWSLESYDYIADYIKELDDEYLVQLKQLFSYCENNKNRNQFRWTLEVGTLQLICGVYGHDKKIKLGSKQLNYELTLINCDEENELAGFEKLKAFANDIAKIPVENSPTYIEYISFSEGLPLFNEERFVAVHEDEIQLTNQLISKVKNYKQSFFEKISDFSLDLTANYMLIRIHLLKYLAILPCLDHDRSGNEVKRIFLETLRRLIEDSHTAKLKGLRGQKRPLPKIYILICLALSGVSQYVPARVLAFIIRKSVAIMAKRFIAGETIITAKDSLEELAKTNRDATIDQLGELVVSKKEADIYLNKVLEIIEGLKEQIPAGAKNQAQINRAHVSIKVTALCHDFKPQDFDYSYNEIAPRLKQILVNAHKAQVFINIDAEHYHYRDSVLRIYEKVLLDNKELHDYQQTGIVVQAYLKDGYKHLKEVMELAKKRNLVMPIRLVKGAYWDAETIEAGAHNFEAPQFLNKEETDIHFRQLIHMILENGDLVQLAIASHNIKDHCFARALREKYFSKAPAIEHQCLHMTYEALSMGLGEMNWPTRNYIPVGDLLVGMAYLVRRIMENSSQVGVLTIMRSHKKSLDTKAPSDSIKLKIDQNKIVYEDSLAVVERKFKNIYPIRTYLKHHLNRVDKSLKELHSSIKAGNLFNENQTDNFEQVFSSSEPDLLLGKIDLDSKESIDQKAKELFSGHQKTLWSEDLFYRIACLYKVADEFLIRREELSALIMLEAGKTIDEACADVDEAIDFIKFYISEQIELTKKGQYQAKGVIGVIAPWNFPLAIPCGMSVAALVSGNTVLLKPAEQTPLIAQEFVEICRSAGLGKDIIDIAHGAGAIGAAIVEHDLINGVVFTGSKAVGEMIYKKITSRPIHQDYKFNEFSKFAITEMGGKNAIIVTNNCELDETVSGVIYSAFAHSGQKCSAASRIIIDRKIKDAFIARFAQAVNDLKVGSSSEYSTIVNPLISKEDQQRVQDLAKRAREEAVKFGGKVIVDRSQEEAVGYCVGPSVFELPKKAVFANDTVATTEVFGPLIHIISYETLDEAIEIFNSTQYALTGGIFCQSQDDIDYLTPKLQAGNLYINRPNTGARVAIEPFGGFKMSGTGPKAGSREYLLSFNLAMSTRKSAVVKLDAKETIKDYIAQYSKLSIERRVYNAKNLLSKIIDQFEAYFGIVAEAQKNKLLDLKGSIKDNKFDLKTREFPNLRIPGQLSFNKKNHSLGNGVILDFSEELDIDLFLDFMINLLVGNGISIIATNDKIYQKWKQIVDLAYLHGFSNFNLSVSIFTPKDLEDFLKQTPFHFYILSSHNIDKNIIETILSVDFDDHMVKIFYAGENENWEQGIDQFTLCRSFAINTMRHGAPLDINL